MTLRDRYEARLEIARKLCAAAWDRQLRDMDSLRAQLEVIDSEIALLLLDGEPEPEMLPRSSLPPGRRLRAAMGR